MFGFQGGESADTVTRKKSYMKDAQDKWRFLTNLDCSSIKTEGQLCDMIKTRSGTRRNETLMPGCRASSFDRISELKIGERKMPTADRNEKNPAIKTEAAEAMAKYGITRVPVDYFHYKEFRYTNLDDAIAQATRQNGAARSRTPK